MNTTTPPKEHPELTTPSTIGQSRLYPLILLLLLLSTVAIVVPITGAAQGTDPDRGSIKGAEAFDIPDWFKQSFLQISEDAVEAETENKHVILFFHLDACPYCDQLLTENFVDAAPDSFIRTNFDAIELNIKGDREVEFNDSVSLTERELAEHLDVKFTPTVLFVDGNNKTVLRTNGYRGKERFQHTLRFVQERAYETQALNSYIASKTDAAYSLRDNAAFSETADLQTASAQPLMVIFEDKACTDCAGFHDQLLARDDVKETLSKIKIVRLDTDSSDNIIAVDGSETTAGEWAKSLSLDYRPAVVLFDRHREIVRIDNRLWSWNFNGIVEWVAGRHYNAYPDMYEYIGELREKRLAEGGDVNFRDDN